MNIELKHIPIKDIFRGYQNDDEDGVVAYGGNLDIRPPFQREFVYNDKERDAVINTVKQGFPLNSMYWCKKSDGTFELLDGQQRTLSICQYLDNDFSFGYQFFHNLTAEEQASIEDYELTIYICEGTEKEKLDWFQTINIAGKELTKQELRNAVYNGSFTYHAKRYFSKSQAPGYNIGKDYIKGNRDRQDFLECALLWVSRAKGQTIEEYMGIHQHDENADELIQYFNSVIDWVKSQFPKYDSFMKGVDWGKLYQTYGTTHQNTQDLQARIDILMEDDEVGNKKGVFEYVLTGDAKVLNLRAYTNSEKKTMYARQHGICPNCHKHFDFDEMEGDHITPWSEGGKTTLENGQMLCKQCNRRKSNH